MEAMQGKKTAVSATGGYGMKNAALVGTLVPEEWVENRDFIRQGKLAPGDLVMVARSDGSTRFGEVVRKIGMFYQDVWEVVVTKSPGGGPGAVRKEEGNMLGRPSKPAMAAYWEAGGPASVVEPEYIPTDVTPDNPNYV